MGVRTGFVLVAGLSRQEVLARLGMRLGEVVDEPDNSDVDLPALGPVLDGWALIVDSPGMLLDDEATLERLGRGTTLVTHSINETVMYADAAGYQDGRRRWWVASDPSAKSRAGSRLRVEGEPPGDVPALLAEALRSEATDPGVELASGHHNVDHQIDVPSQVIAAATAGAFDGWPLDESWTFHELIPTDPAGRARVRKLAATRSATPSGRGARRRWLAYLLFWAAVISLVIQVAAAPDPSRDPPAWAPFAAAMATTVVVLAAAFLLLPPNPGRRGRVVAARVVALLGVAWALTGLALLGDRDYQQIDARLVHCFVLLAIAFLVHPKHRRDIPAGVAVESDPDA